MPAVKERVLALVVGRARSRDGESVTITANEINGRKRTFKCDFARYSDGGHRTTTPNPGNKVTVLLDSRGKVLNMAPPQ